MRFPAGFPDLLLSVDILPPSDEDLFQQNLEKMQSIIRQGHGHRCCCIVHQHCPPLTALTTAGAPNLSLIEEIRSAVAMPLREISPVPEDYSFLSDYDHPSSPIKHYSVQSSCSALPTTENPHTAPVEHSHASPPYGMNINVEPALAPVTRHPHTDATGLDNQGASSNKEANNRQVLELENEVEGKRILFLFGEVCEFEKEMLIQLWMAMEFLTDEGIGGNYFEKLVYEGYILCVVANSLYKVNNGKLKTELDMMSDERNYVILDNGSQSDAGST